MIIDLSDKKTVVLVTDAVHIYANAIMYAPEIAYLLWKPGDPVEAPDNKYIRATSTLLIDRSAFTPLTREVFIPYATSIETFNSDDNGILQEQACFGSSTIIHVNQTLYTYMNNNSAIWGNIMGNVIADQ